PTTSCTGRHSSISRAMAAKRSVLASTARVVSALARRVSNSPTATPMRARPKSNPSTVPRAGALGMTGGLGQVGEVDPQQLHGCCEAFFGGQVEDDAEIGRRGQPGVFGQLLFELARVPAGV